MSRRRSREEEVDEVGARDDQHEADGAQQQELRLTRGRVDPRLVEGSYRRTPPLVALMGHLGGDVCADEFYLAPGLSERYTGSEASYHVLEMLVISELAVVGGKRPHRLWYPQVGPTTQPAKRRRRNTDDRHRNAIDPNGSAHYRGVGTEPAAPQCVPKHYNGMGPWRHVYRQRILAQISADKHSLRKEIETACFRFVNYVKNIGPAESILIRFAKPD